MTVQRSYVALLQYKGFFLLSAGVLQIWDGERGEKFLILASTSLLLSKQSNHQNVPQLLVCVCECVSV